MHKTDVIDSHEFFVNVPMTFIRGKMDIWTRKSFLRKCINQKLLRKWKHDLIWYSSFFSF